MECEVLGKQSSYTRVSYTHGLPVISLANQACLGLQFKVCKHDEPGATRRELLYPWEKEVGRDIVNKESVGGIGSFKYSDFHWLNSNSLLLAALWPGKKRTFFLRPWTIFLGNEKLFSGLCTRLTSIH